MFTCLHVDIRHWFAFAVKVTNVELSVFAISMGERLPVLALPCLICLFNAGYRQDSELLVKRSIAPK